jgi:hypothetical protein
MIPTGVRAGRRHSTGIGESGIPQLAHRTDPLATTACYGKVRCAGGCQAARRNFAKKRYARLANGSAAPAQFTIE